VRGLLLFLFGAALSARRLPRLPLSGARPGSQGRRERLEARQKEAQALEQVAGRLPEFKREQQELQER
jgi:hypothetical protein